MENAAYHGIDHNLIDPNYVGTFCNNLYQVILREFEFNEAGDKYQWLVIRRRDSEPAHDWRHFQRIKNDLCGPECEGVEIYPAESRLVDESNQYHLFVMPPGFTFPFGYVDRIVSDKIEPGNKNKQRPFAEPPAGLNARAPEDIHTRIFGGMPKVPSRS